MELGAYLKRVSLDLRQDAEVRRLARQLSEGWEAGIVPSPRRVKQLREMVDAYEVCGRLEEDGSCSWLRKNARDQKLRLAPGQKAYCKRSGRGKLAHSYQNCDGFRKKREGDHA